MTDIVPFSRTVLFLCIAFAAGGSAAASAQAAEPLFDAGVRLSYEENINGARDGGTAVGDHYTTVFASLGSYAELAEATTYLVVKTGLEAYAYEDSEELDGVTCSLSAGIHRRAGERFAWSLLLKASGKDFRDDRRDGGAVGMTLEVRQQPGEDLWIKEVYEFEHSGARTDLFAYDGHTLGVWLGFRAARTLFLGAGYAWRRQDFADTSGFRQTTRTASAAIEHRLAERVFASIRYDRQWYSTLHPEGAFDNSISSAALIFSY